jgi:hypothetical protein
LIAGGGVIAGTASSSLRLLTGLMPRESCSTSRSWSLDSAFALRPARATSRMLVARLSRLVELSFASVSRRAAPPMKLLLLSPWFSRSFSPRDLPRENRFLIHPLTLEVGDAASLSFLRPLSVVPASVSIAAGALGSLDSFGATMGGETASSLLVLAPSSIASSPETAVLPLDRCFSSLAWRRSSARAAFSSAFLALYSCFSWSIK